jgi:hypothetical protein
MCGALMLKVLLAVTNYFHNINSNSFYMKARSLNSLTEIMAFFLVVFITAKGLNVQSQDQKYYPMGDPKKWNVELSPFVWLPMVNGQVTSELVDQQFDQSAIDLLKDLKFAAMFNADISKGKFFVSPSYIYTKLGSEQVLRTTINGEDALVAVPDFRMNILEVIGGMRFDLGQKVYLDPFVGFRYNKYSTTVQLDFNTIDSSSNVAESADFWDPTIGLRVHYYPAPRVPLIFKSCIGGFGAGSTLSWQASVNGGYSISPLIDILAGITAYYTDFEKDNANGDQVGLTTMMAGFDIGIRFILPARYKDPNIFKKGKK